MWNIEVWIWWKIDIREFCGIDVFIRFPMKFGYDWHSILVILLYRLDLIDSDSSILKILNFHINYISIFPMILLKEICTISKDISMWVMFDFQRFFEMKNIWLKRYYDIIYIKFQACLLCWRYSITNDSSTLIKFYFQTFFVGNDIFD